MPGYKDVNAYDVPVVLAAVGDVNEELTSAWTSYDTAPDIAPHDSVICEFELVVAVPDGADIEVVALFVLDQLLVPFETTARTLK